MIPTSPTATASMSTSANTSATRRPDLFLPYAKDHDRLQLALLYIEAECNRYKETGTQLKKLRTNVEIIQQSLEKLSRIREATIKQYIHEHHPAKYIDSNGQAVDLDPDSQMPKSKEEFKARCDREMERVFSMERCELKALAFVQTKIERIEEQQKWLDELVIQKENILKLIEELHATAFDGDTPEFPHEDQLEALVEVAEVALKGSKPYSTSSIKMMDDLDDVSAQVHMIYAKLNCERPISPGIFLLKEFWKLKIHDRCKTVAQRFQAWKEGVDKHFSEHPDTILSPRAQSKLPKFEPKELLELLSEAASSRALSQHTEGQNVELLIDAYQARGEVRAAASAIQLMKEHAEKSVAKANTMLKLRRRQLSAARSQILDHVVDPDKCPLEQRGEELPDYPEQIVIHGLSQSHPLVSHLLTESETYSVEAQVNDVVNSRLSRARRTTHPPILESARYQPPMYNELEDPELVRGRYERDVPPMEGDTPEYTEEPDYEGYIQTETSEVSPIVRGELAELVSTARAQLGLKSKSQRDQFNDMLRTVMGILEGSGIPLIMPGPGVRF
ncbi:hypothetical protein B0J17DRAFT_721608 [Rhizoctonia solani]|nr:hypothetical protein B0J17DRAFT_721608 [Rhizoctonia solani]